MPALILDLGNGRGTLRALAESRIAYLRKIWRFACADRI
jgi:hypothetical protein